MLNTSCQAYSGSDGELNAELFQHSGDCIKIINLDGQVCLLNPGGVVALELEHSQQLLGNIWADVWPEENRHLASNAFNRAKRGQSGNFQAFCPTAKGNPRWWDVVTSPVLNEAGAVKEVMVVSRDVSELFLARQALHDADRRKNEFLAAVAHELRTPLGAAFNGANLLKLSAVDPRTVEITDLIQRQLGHMSRIAEDLLDASRIGRGELSLKTERVDVKLLLAEAVEQLRPAFTAKKQTVVPSLCDHDCIVSGDYTRLLQVAGNLLGNAIRYTPPCGDISLTLARDGEHVAFSVIDSGIGIAPDRMPTIFEVFTQADKTGTSKADGLGIGLSLVQAFVTLHGGTVRAASGGVNLGSHFTVTLPAAD
jgi:PAS domain S-box-containing protein